MTLLTRQDIDPKSNLESPQADLWLQRNLEIIKELFKGVPQILHVQDVSITVANTVTETILHSLAIPANTFHAGAMVAFKTVASYSNASASDDFTIRLKVNGATVHTLSRVGGNKTDVGLEADLALTFRTVGASGTFVHSGKLIDDAAVYTSAHATTDTVDTTAIITLTVTLQWDAAKSGNTLTASQGHSELLQSG